LERVDVEDEPHPTALHWRFPSSADGVGIVRRELGAALQRRDVPEDAHEAVLLVVNELAANAVEHGAGPVDVRATFAGASVRIAVSDASPEPPRLRPPSTVSLRGRGMQMVDRLAVRWSWHGDGAGKTVWADVPTDRALDDP
jgi:anti-sigma regulatory factor (Ser/Thr protein kinase)